jgi:hypothetical protein
MSRETIPLAAGVIGSRACLPVAIRLRAFDISMALETRPYFFCICESLPLTIASNS